MRSLKFTVLCIYYYYYYYYYHNHHHHHHHHHALREHMFPTLYLLL